MAHVPEEPPRGDRRHGPLHGADGDLPSAVRVVRDQAFPARDRALECHGEAHGVVGGPAVAGGVPEAGRSRYLVFDRDAIFSAAVVSAVTSMVLEPTRTSYQSPWQNGVAERFVGTVRRELLDHAIVLDDRHLRRLLGEYLAYYHEDRTHLGIAKDAPLARAVEPRPAGAAVVHARLRVGGLHHRYVWGMAA